MQMEDWIDVFKNRAKLSRDWIYSSDGGNKREKGGIYNFEGIT